MGRGEVGGRETILTTLRKLNLWKQFIQAYRNSYSDSLQREKLVSQKPTLVKEVC